VETVWPSEQADLLVVADGPRGGADPTGHIADAQADGSGRDLPWRPTSAPGPGRPRGWLGLLAPGRRAPAHETNSG